MDLTGDPTIMRDIGGFFERGGFPMYPILLFGILTLRGSILFLLRLKSEIVPVVVTTGLLALATGLLGTATHLVYVCDYVHHRDAETALRIITLGSADAMTNTVFALFWVVLGTLVMLGGFVRRANRPGS
jgi:hypothetical protein